MRISAVIPTRNEMNSVGDVVQNCKSYCDEVIVVDDGSTDDSSRAAMLAGARVIQGGRHLGFVKAVEVGLKAASGDIIITLDADGQHDPSEIPSLIRPILSGTADLVLGSRGKSQPFSERLIVRLVQLSVNCDDVGTGYRALTRSLVKKIPVWGYCMCGSLVLEAHKHGAKIVEVPIRLRTRQFGETHWPGLSRGITHCKQAGLIILWLIRNR